MFVKLKYIPKCVYSADCGSNQIMQLLVLAALSSSFLIHRILFVFVLAHLFNETFSRDWLLVNLRSEIFPFWSLSKRSFISYDAGGACPTSFHFRWTWQLLTGPFSTKPMIPCFTNIVGYRIWRSNAKTDFTRRIPWCRRHARKGKFGSSIEGRDVNARNTQIFNIHIDQRRIIER